MRTVPVRVPGRPRRPTTYVGPAALAAAQRLLEEPRGVDPERILDWADGSERRLAMPRRVRMHGGLSLQRPPGGADHGAPRHARRRTPDRGNGDAGMTRSGAPGARATR